MQLIIREMMKIVGLFDKVDSEVGFRLAGVETHLINNSEDLERILPIISSCDEANEGGAGIVVVNDAVWNMAPEKFESLEAEQLPLVIKV